MANMVGIAEIAKRLNVEVTTVRRLIARESEALGLELHRGKGEKFLLSQDDADRLVASYEARRGSITAKDKDEIKFDRYGCFYLIQLIPEALPNRVKIGFADNVDQRLNEHRTSAPTAKLVKLGHASDHGTTPPWTALQEKTASSFSMRCTKGIFKDSSPEVISSSV